MTAEDEWEMTDGERDAEQAEECERWDEGGGGGEREEGDTVAVTMALEAAAATTREVRAV